LFSPRFLALLAAVMVLAVGAGWFFEATTSTAALQQLIAGKRPDRAGRPPAYDFSINTTQSPHRDYAPPPGLPAAIFPERATEACSLPYADPSETVVVFRASEGQAISSVSLSAEEGTWAADVEIEPGQAPLYVVLASNRPMVWRIGGAARRIAHLVLMTSATAPDGGVAAGAVGVAAEKITAVKESDCYQAFDDPKSLAAAAATTALAGRIGRQPGVIGATDAIAAVTLPSARAAKLTEGDAPPPPGLDRRVWDASARRNAPAGVMQIAAADVKGPEAATPYDILPGQAGIAQLVASGQLVMTSDGYRIAQPIAHFPVGPLGANFLLPNNVPMPSGSIGNSCVLDENGRPIAGCGLGASR
jgi:hypothetical protein